MIGKAVSGCSAGAQPSFWTATYVWGWTVSPDYYTASTITPLILLYFTCIFTVVCFLIVTRPLTVFTVPTKILNLFIYLSNAQRALHLPVA